MNDVCTASVHSVCGLHGVNNTVCVRNCRSHLVRWCLLMLLTSLLTVCERRLLLQLVRQMFVIVAVNWLRS